MPARRLLHPRAVRIWMGMPWLDSGWIISPDELDSWTLARTSEFIAVNKPGGVVCHRSRHGPWSSLVGAVRERYGLDRVYLPSRLDRETSGVVLVCLTQQAASLLQQAAAARLVSKTYLALLDGVLEKEIEVDAPIGKAQGSLVRVKRAVTPGGQTALTRFIPISNDGRRTFVRIIPETGRQHQIRVHASSIGHPVTADKIYGCDESLYIEFAELGWTPRLAAALPYRRHALHAAGIEFRLPGWTLFAAAPWPSEPGFSSKSDSK